MHVDIDSAVACLCFLKRISVGCFLGNDHHVPTMPTRTTYELLAEILVTGAAVVVSYGVVLYRFVRQHKSIGWPRNCARCCTVGSSPPTRRPATLWKLSECFFTPVAFLVALGMLASAGSNTVLSIMLAMNVVCLK